MSPYEPWGETRFLQQLLTLFILRLLFISLSMRRILMKTQHTFHVLTWCSARRGACPGGIDGCVGHWAVGSLMECLAALPVAEAWNQMIFKSPPTEATL